MRKQKPFVINRSEEVEKYVVTKNGKYFYDESSCRAGHEGISRGWRGDRPPGGFCYLTFHLVLRRSPRLYGGFLSTLPASEGLREESLIFRLLQG